MQTDYDQFSASLDTVAPVQQFKDGTQGRMFFGFRYTSKEDIVDFVKTMPQLDDAIGDYKAYPLDRPIWDMAVVLWASALKDGDWEYADQVRVHAASHGVQLSRFKGNVLMRTP